MRATNCIDNVVTKISALYLHSIKDRLYCDSLADTEELRKVLLAVYLTLSKVLWPIVPFLVEECWSYFDKKRTFYMTPVNVPSSWSNSSFDPLIELVQSIKANIKQNSSQNTWRLNLKIVANSNALQLLQVNDELELFKSE